MFKEGSPIVYGAAADLKKWPSLKGQRLNGKSRPYLVFSGTLAECVRELMSKPIKGISLYDIVTDPHPQTAQACPKSAQPDRTHTGYGSGTSVLRQARSAPVRVQRGERQRISVSRSCTRLNLKQSL